MKYLKMLGIAAVAAMSFMAFASSASATTLEVNNVTQKTPLTLVATLEEGTVTLARTDGSLANTCTTSEVHGTANTTEGAGGVWNVTGPITGHTHQERTEGKMGLTFGNCTRPVTVHDPGTLKVEHIASTTNGTVTSEEAEVTVGSPFGTLNCKTGAGAHLGTLTGTASGHATMDINAVLNCGFLVPSATWVGKYTITTPTNLGVEA